MTSLSIVIPVYNAEKTIEPLCRELIERYGSEYRLSIILVNDHSKDSTHQVCHRLHEAAPDVITYLRLSRNFGEHCAVMAGLNQAQGDFCVVMDDDFQNPPQEIATLLAEMEKGYDAVYACYAIKNDRSWRNIGSFINDKMANIVLRKPADLYLSSFKVMNRFLVQEIIKFTGSDPYIDAIVLRTTGNIGKVKVRHDKRALGCSGYTFKKLFSLWGNMLVSCSLIPLRIMGTIGLILTLVGTYRYGMGIIHDLLPQLKDPTELEKLTSNLAFFRGFELLAISLVGEYVGRIYLNLNRDPQFIIRELYSSQRKSVAIAGKENA